jgi:hypothetical protein
MAKLDRKDVKIFAEDSKETLITEFRTEDSGGATASFSRDPDVIQNENYSQGWVNDTNNLNTKIYGEDLNAVNYVLSYLLKYLYENGIAEWKSTTTYYQNSICKVDNALYLSLQNNNIGNDPTSTVSYWKLIPLENVSIEDAGSGFSIVKDVTDNVITFKTISVTGYGEITDNGDQLNIDIAGGGGGGGGDTYWGMIRGTITNQTDLMALINLKQDIFTVDSPLVLTDEQHLTINKATSSVSGYLDYNDFNTFNGKQDTISATLPISITNNNIEIETADTSTTGVLSYTDWNTFNNKQNAINGLTITETSTTFDAVPKSTITTSNIGSSTYPITNIYSGTSYNNTTNTSTITNTPDENNMIDMNINGFRFLRIDHQNTSDVIRISELDSGALSQIYVDEIRGKTSISSDSFEPLPSSSTAKIGSSSSAFSKGYIDEVYLSTIHGASNNITVSSNINPDSTDNNRKLGSSSNKFYEGWISYVKTSQLASIAGGTKLNLGYDYMSPATADQYQLGYQNRFLYVYSQHFDQGSDIRNKSNIKDYNESVLDKIKNITPITYNYKSEDRTTLGISAQELKEIEPLIVHTQIKETKDGKDEDLGIDLYSLSVFAIKAIKELNAKVEALEARVDKLEGNKKELEK